MKKSATKQNKPNTMGVHLQNVNIPEASLDFAVSRTYFRGNSYIEVWSEGICKYKTEVPSDIGAIKADGKIDSPDGKDYEFSIEYYDTSLQSIQVYCPDNYPEVLWAWQNN